MSFGSRGAFDVLTETFLNTGVAMVSVRGRARCRALAISMLAGLVAVIGATPFTPGMSYHISVVTSMPSMGGMNAGDMMISGHGVSVASHSRVHIDTVRPAHTPLPPPHST